ncbi:efflux RND transporter periplasmic adaptor subunit [Shewanella marina]|uniref:efflux RND transporter periplasmic adaptor subunit n=1 Tax=Shewanella marina TaxID=487319 RepID=UPI00046FCAEA|nr:efflux RND transporter periplasmic adaptor subunit [Shewanella marina]
MDLYKKIITLACISLLISGCQPEQEAEEQQVYAIPVETGQIKQGQIASFYETHATLEAPQSAQVVSRITGLIIDLKVEEGQQVTQGQLLATIDAKRQQYDLDKADAEVKIIKQELDRLIKIKNKQFTSAERIAKLEFNLKAAIARRDLAALQVKESQIIAPIDGVIASRYIHIGTMAKEFDPLFFIVNQQQLHGIIHLPEAELGSIKLGQHASIMTAAKQHHNASVLRISPVIDSQTGTFKTTLLIPNPNQQLKTGMFTQVKLQYDSRDNAMTIPYEAIINQDNQYSVFIADGDKALQKTVQLGYKQDDMVEIINGLELNDNLIVKGQQNLKDDVLIEVINRKNLASADQ